MSLPSPPRPSGPSWFDVLRLAYEKGEAEALLAEIDFDFAEFMDKDWSVWARPDQLPPGLPPDGVDWSVWLVLGGRGAGKTRAGAEWVRGMALGRSPFSERPVGRIALVGETLADVREVMIEGVSGLLAVHPRAERPQWQASRRRLEWPNGAVAQAFSAEDPESLRGPQFGAAWLDDLGKWKIGEETFDQLQFGLRLGSRPRQTVTTTPRSTPLLKRLAGDPRTVTTRARTWANARNLAPGFLDGVLARYGGTRLARQELDGEFVNERADALWRRDAIETARVAAADVPQLVRIVVAVDPPAGSGRRSDACGIVAAGVDAARNVFVLADATVEHARPHVWAERATALWREFEADALVIETNQGGEMAEAVLREADHGVPVTPVRAVRGKAVRAEPVALLYEQGRVRHAGRFEALEDEMCDFGPTGDGWGLSNGKSPDRLDALVWAVTALALGPKAGARIRRL